METVIRGGTPVTSTETRAADLLIRDGKIARIEAGLESYRQGRVVDARRASELMDAALRR